MKVRILKSFRFSPDGFTAAKAIAGGIEDIPDDAIAGLRAAGFVAAIDENSPILITESPDAQDRDDVPQRDRRKRGK